MGRKKVSAKKTWGIESSCTHSYSTFKLFNWDFLLYTPTARWRDRSKRAPHGLIDWPRASWPLISQLLGQPMLFAIKKSDSTELYLVTPHSLTYTLCLATEGQNNIESQRYKSSSIFPPWDGELQWIAKRFLYRRYSLSTKHTKIRKKQNSSFFFLPPENGL